MTFRSPRNVTLERQILADIVPKSSALAQFLAALMPSEAKSAAHAPNWHLVRMAAIQALKDHQQFVADPNRPGSRGGIAPPADIAALLLESLTIVADGELPPIFHPTRTPSGRGSRRHAQQQEDVVSVVRLLTAVDAGWIDVPGSRSWVANEIGVSRRQVHRWLNEAGSLHRRKGELEQWVAATFRDASRQRVAEFLKSQISQIRRRRARR